MIRFRDPIPRATGSAPAKKDPLKTEMIPSEWPCPHCGTRGILIESLRLRLRTIRINAARVAGEVEHFARCGTCGAAIEKFRPPSERVSPGSRE